LFQIIITKESFMPSPFLKTIDTPAIGGNGGAPFTIDSNPDGFPVKTLTIYSSLYNGARIIRGMEIVFANSITPYKTGTIESSFSKSTYAFVPNEALTSFSIYTGSINNASGQAYVILVGIKFTTTLDKTFSVGNLAGTLNELDVTGGSILYGIHGASGLNIDKLGLKISVPVRLAAMYDLVYDLGAKPLGTPKIVGNLVLSNNSSKEQSSSMTAQYGLERTSSWSVEAGGEVSVAVGTEFTIKGGIPFISEGEAKASVEVTATATFNYTYGRVVTESESLQVMVAAAIPAASTITAQLIVLKAELDIPYTAKAIVYYVDGTQSDPVVVNGRFKGVSQWDLNVAYNAPTSIKLSSQVTG
jgi:Aerolysin toxin